ncbi:MAG: hypothetical protein ABR987_21525 [Terracidiphilus sp.]|jgi:hypothetical protein
MANPLNALTKRVAELEKHVHVLRGVEGEQNGEAVSDSTTEDKKQNEMGHTTPVRPRRNPTKIQANNPKSNWSDSIKWWKSHPFEWWKLRLELLALLAGIGYAVVTYLQWRDLRHNFEAEQRSWLQVGSNLQSFGSNIPDTVAVSVKNTGKSVADKIEGIAAFEIISKENTPGFYRNDRPKNHVTGGIAFPDTAGSGWIVSSLDENGNYIPVLDSDKKRLLNGDAYIAVYGQIYYQDRFGGHWTRFCDWKAYVPGGYASKACTTWAAVGDGNPPAQ